MRLEKLYAFLTIMFSLSIFAHGFANLIIVEGHFTHSPEDGIPPIPKVEMIEKAHQKALEKLLDESNFMQVSKWQDQVICEPDYKNSPNCYKGTVATKASFVEENRYKDIWQVDLFESVHWHNYGDVDYEFTNKNAYERAYSEAIKKAKFFCNGDIALPPIEEQRYTIDGNYDYPCLVSIYQATFQCMKNI